MLRLALKNLFRNKRRTIITLLSIFFAAGLTSFFRYLAEGQHRDMIAQTASLTTGYVQIAAYGYEQSHSLERALDITPDLLQILQDHQVFWTPRITSGALVQSGQESRFVQVQSIHPEQEKQVTKIHTKVKKGTWIKHAGECAIGENLARALGADVGSEISLVTSRFDGSVGALNVHVSAILLARRMDVDHNMIFLTLDDGEELFAPSEGGEEGVLRFTSLALATSDAKSGDDLARKLRKHFPEPVTPMAAEKSPVYDPVVLDWRRLNPELKQYLTLDDVGNEFSFSFLLLIMAFGVLTTVEMSVQERKKEFGVLLALGTKPSHIIQTLLLETFLLLIAGTALGILTGMAVSFYFYIHPIVLSGDMAEAMVQFGSLVELRPAITMDRTLLTAFSILLPPVLFSWFAVRGVYKLNPVEVLKD
jgi:ABC-type lipoprotein release transport system permease subunit